jgi:hypothetical protein
MGEALQSQIQCYLHHPNQEPDWQEQIAPECQTLKAHTSTRNGDQGFAASFTIPIEKSMLESLIRVLLTMSRYNFTVQNNCEEKLCSKVILHFEQTPQQQFAFQGKCLDRESHLFEHSLQPKFFLGFPGHQSHQVPRHHQLSVTKVIQEFTWECIGVHTEGTFSNTIQNLVITSIYYRLQHS